MPKKEVSKDSLRVKALKHSARRHSIKEGIFASAKTAFGDHYLSPFAIAINSSSSLVAMLSSVSGLLGPLTQMFSSRLMRKYPRKKIILRAIIGESTMFLPFAAIAILFYKGIITSFLPLLLLLVFSLYIIFANITAPAWFSWMGDIVDEQYRGRWFSKRSLILGFVSITLALLVSFFLNFLKEKKIVMFGFMGLFFLAFIARIASGRVVKKQYEPKIKIKKEDYFSFWDFLKKASKTNFGKFAIFRAFFAFACSVSAPLLAVYLLRNLKFDYVTYMIVVLSASIYSLIALGMWGRLSDRYGNYRMLEITAMLIPLIPILWILSPSPLYMIFIPAIIDGIMWAGFDLSTSNFIYDNVSSKKRGFAVSYYNMLNGLGVFLGAGLGALLIKIINIKNIEPIFIIFIFSGVLRMIVVSFWLPKIREIRKTGDIKGRKALKEIIFKEIKPTILEEVHQIRSIKQYLAVK
jgi:MFS family permease